ncbi:MAG TPA: hypothetical protein VJ843_00545 [Candidatus Saccharimonadales bacterium]|nr:hypothetical protein [Candidatus Saccharimonadales bacterium]
MATFYYDAFSYRSYLEQWQRHLDQTSLINNIDDIVRTQTSEYNKALNEMSNQQAEIMRAATEAICGTISEGLSVVIDGLYGIENSVHKLTNLLDWHMKTMIDELRYNNLLSQNIALLLREPDSEKVRQKNIEKGLKFSNDAIRDSFFFNDALHFFKKAEEADHTDYFVLHKIGLIYLYSIAHLDFDAAIDYFSRASKYSEVDTHPNSIRLATILAGDITKPLQAQNRTVDYVKYFTGESYLQMAIAYYAQGKFLDSSRVAERAYKVAPSFLEAGFFWAKSLAALDENKKAAEILKPLIQQDEIYSIKTLTDRDLSTKIEILQMTEELRLEEKDNAIALLKRSSQLKETVINEWKILESSLADDFRELCKNIDLARGFMKRDNYLSYLKANRYFHQFILNI